MKKVPYRTCVMCREKTEKKLLLRIIRTPEGKVEFDPTGKKNGRGAYVCRKEECLNNIKNIKKIQSALETQANKEELEEVFSEIREYIFKNGEEINAGKESI